MWANLKNRLLYFVQFSINLIRNNVIARLGLLATVIAILQAIGVLEPVLSWFESLLSGIILFLTRQYFGIPYAIWLLVMCLFGSIFLWLSRVSSYLKLVSGEFYDDFSNGLLKWNYGGEGWTIERDGKQNILSVTNSGNGGITQAGFWDRFSFRFDCKLMDSGKVGWLVKAWDRSNYIMLQLVIMPEDGEDISIKLTKGIYVRPHFKYQGKWITWPHKRLDMSAVLIERIRRFSWFDVEIIVRGSTIDLYLESEHAYHLHLDDPLRIEDVEHYELVGTDKEKSDEKAMFESRKLNVFSYPSGKVGFRCHSFEHAHFRKIRVRPVW